VGASRPTSKAGKGGQERTRTSDLHDVNVAL
jgi:hypothetical protein